MTWRERLRLWSLEFLSQVLALLSGVIIGAAGVGASFGWGKPWTWFVVGVGALSAVGAVLHEALWRKPTLTRLNRENKELTAAVSERDFRLANKSVDLVAVVNVLLREMAVSLGMHTSGTRFSVYRHKGESFYLVGRVSANPHYAKSGRVSYPDRQGFIGQLWSGTNTNDTVSFPKDRALWDEMQAGTYGFTLKEARSLTMQTLYMTGVKLQRDHHGTAFGILCVECDNQRRTVFKSTPGKVAQTPQFESLTAVLHVALSDLAQDEARQGISGVQQD